MNKSHKRKSFRKNKTRRMNGGTKSIKEQKIKQNLGRMWREGETIWVVSGPGGIRYYRKREKGEETPSNMDDELLINSKGDLQKKLTKYYMDDKTYKVSTPKN
jgi:hypothetical protein